jgi:thioredoxin reductase
MTADIAIIGAGPYGLSLAAHLRARGIEHRIFGTPMQTWRSHMPEGMRLKSEGFASSLYDGGRGLTLRAFCAERGIAYRDTGLPVTLGLFCDYGLDFQARRVPHLETTDVAGVEPGADGFSITLADGRVCRARRVVIATGISQYEQVPDWMAGLPPEVAGHASRHARPAAFAGRRVAVIGAGASAIDLAALLGEAGAETHLIARGGRLAFLGPPALKPRGVWESLRAPQSGLGPGWKSRLCTDAPLLFRALPEKFRFEVVRRHLGPSAGWWTRAPVEAHVGVHLETRVVAARARGGAAELGLLGADGGRRTECFDQVIAATGYRPDLRRLGFLPPALRERIAAAAHIPRLSANFETSVPGLYVTGLAAAYTFGPLLRFAFGAEFTARRLSRHFAGILPRTTVRGAALPAETRTRGRQTAEAA